MQLVTLSFTSDQVDVGAVGLLGFDAARQKIGVENSE